MFQPLADFCRQTRLEPDRSALVSAILSVVTAWVELTCVAPAVAANAAVASTAANVTARTVVSLAFMAPPPEGRCPGGAHSIALGDPVGEPGGHVWQIPPSDPFALEPVRSR